jgi:hypothetical protein
MPTASGPHIECGIKFINMMLRLESAGPHIGKPGGLCSVYQLNWNIWKRSMILLIVI